MSRFYLAIFYIWSFFLYPATYLIFWGTSLSLIRPGHILGPDGFLALAMLSCFLAIHYLTYIGHRLSFWLHFLTILFFSGCIMNYLPTFLMVEMPTVSRRLFSNYEEVSSFATLVGVIILFLFWYLWTGTEYILRERYEKFKAMSQHAKRENTVDDFLNATEIDKGNFRRSSILNLKAKFKGVIEHISSIFFIVIIFIFSALCFILIIYAAVIDIQADRIGYGIANILVPPMGIIRGILLFFGLV